MKSLTQLAAHFGKLAAGAYIASLEPVLDMIGSHVKTEVEREIGEYQSDIGPYPATAELSDATLDRKSRDGLGKGGNPDTPLWATGAYHDSIQVHKHLPSLSVEIGTDVEYVVFHELGTFKMPPRPIFGPSALRALPPLLPAIAAAAGAGIAGGVWAGLGAKAIAQTSRGAGAELLP